MIRGSLFVAIAAFVLSLFMHVLGFGFAVTDLPKPQSEDGPTDTAALSNAFEDLAETPPEPVAPEPAEVPKPSVEIPSEPELAEIPTSEALVVSTNPEQSFAPDTGTGPITTPEIPELDVIEPEGRPDSEESASDDITETPSIEPEGAFEATEGISDAPADELETITPEPPVSDQVAALPPVLVPTAPVVPLELEAVDPEIPYATVEALPETPETIEAEQEPTEPEQAVTTSLRPRLPDRRPPIERRGRLENFNNFDNLRFPEQTIDSPLDTYRREGVDNFTVSSSGNNSGGRGPGNSDLTNYAGQILVHLNRTPTVFAHVRGFAKVFFQIDPDGSLAFVHITQSSGSADVERAAKEQVRNAAPFPLPPGGTSRKLSFVYQSG